MLVVFIITCHGECQNPLPCLFLFAFILRFACDICFMQWELKGSYAAMVVTCTEQNQLCVVQCGGNNGACMVKNDALQLNVIDQAMLHDQNCLST